MSLDNNKPFPFPILGRLESLTLSKLKTWWKTLGNYDKEVFCRIDSEDIMTGLVTAANKAFYLSRMNQAYKKKGLISKDTELDEHGEALCLMIQFNLVDKGIIKDNWANLLSCFYLSVPQGQKAEGNGHKMVDMQEECSYISVKKDRLDVILDLLTSSVPNFGEGDKPVYDEQALLELFSSISDGDSSKIDVSMMDLKPDLKRLLEILVAIAVMLEHHIYVAYFQQVASKTNQKEISQTVTDQFNFLSSQFDLGNEDLPTPLMIKTVSQLEKSEMPAKPALDVNDSILSTRSKYSEDYEQDQAGSVGQLYGEIATFYDGFIMDNLVVEFESFDCLLSNEEKLDAIIEGTYTESSDDEGSFCESYPSAPVYRQPPSRVHDMQQQYYPLHQGQFMNHAAYLPQQQYTPPPGINFEMPIAMPMQHHENFMPNYGGYYHPQEYQSHGSFNSGMYAHQNNARTYLPQQNFQPYRDNNSQFLVENLMHNEQKPRHYPKAQLPPRLQRQKEQTFNHSQIVN